jgi:hypothetical protein
VRFGLKISLAQNRVTISPEPTFVIECVNPGGMSITWYALPLTEYSSIGSGNEYLSKAFPFDELR